MRTYYTHTNAYAYMYKIRTNQYIIHTQGHDDNLSWGASPSALPAQSYNSASKNNNTTSRFLVKNGVLRDIKPSLGELLGLIGGDVLRPADGDATALRKRGGKFRLASGNLNTSLDDYGEDYFTSVSR